MEVIIFQGTKYSDKVCYRDGETFDEAPYVVLFNQSLKVYFGVDTTPTQGATAGTSYDFEFTPEITAQMPPGIYHLEIYKNDNMVVVLQRNDNHAEVKKSAMSSDSSCPIQNS